eukprot:COSAG02_NODE_4317_length_5511_cov_264.675536_3_plen_141_part_00
MCTLLGSLRRERGSRAPRPGEAARAGRCWGGDDADATSVAEVTSSRSRASVSAWVAPLRSCMGQNTTSEQEEEAREFTISKHSGASGRDQSFSASFSHGLEMGFIVVCLHCVLSCFATRYFVMNVIWASASRNLLFFSAC